MYKKVVEMSRYSLGELGLPLVEALSLFLNRCHAEKRRMDFRVHRSKQGFPRSDGVGQTLRSCQVCVSQCILMMAIQFKLRLTNEKHITISFQLTTIGTLM